jgi:hypothetical protein
LVTSIFPSFIRQLEMDTGEPEARAHLVAIFPVGLPAGRISSRALALPLLRYRSWVLAPPSRTVLRKVVRRTTLHDRRLIGRAIRALLAVTTGCWGRRWRGPAQPAATRARSAVRQLSSARSFRSLSSVLCCGLASRECRAAPRPRGPDPSAPCPAVLLSRPFARDPPKPAFGLWQLRRPARFGHFFLVNIMQKRSFLLFGTQSFFKKSAHIECRLNFF